MGALGTVQMRGGKMLEIRPLKMPGKRQEDDVTDALKALLREGIAFTRSLDILHCCSPSILSGIGLFSYC
jgi:hypothetical protein